MRTKIFSSFIFGAVVLGGIPVPQDMTLLYWYQYPTGTYEQVVRPATATTTEIINPQPNFEDDDHNGLISVAVFKASNGTITYQQMPDKQYTDTGKKGGNKFWPKKTELRPAVALLFPNAQAAVARDTSLTPITVASGSSISTAYNNAGTTIVAFTYQEGSDSETSATFNGDALTFSTKGYMCYSAGSNTHTGSVWYITGADAGNYTLQVNRSTSSAHWELAALSYSNAGAPDASTTFRNGSAGSCTGSGTSLSGSLTTVTDNSWIAGFARFDNGGTVSGTGSFTKVAQGASGEPGIEAIFDTNGAITPAGATTIGANNAAVGSNWIFVAIAVPPTAAAAVKVPDIIWINEN